METSQQTVNPPRKVLVLLDNLFFAAKINQAAMKANVSPVYAKTSDQAMELAHRENPTQIIVDLDAANCSALEFIARLKREPGLQSIPTLGFVSHVNVELQKQAREAGCDRVLARSVFDRSLITILNQYS